MRKKSVISVLLICLICVLPILCILMVHHTTLCNTIQRMEDGTFGESKSLVHLSTNSSNTREKLFKTLKDQDASVALYLDDTTTCSYTIRYMSFTDKYITLPMINGRFLEKTDLKEDNNVAVVGKSVKGIYEKNGKKYIDICDKKYQVIGTVGYEEETPFDDYIFINLFSCKDENLSVYTLDFFSNCESESLLNKCINEMQKTSCDMEILSETDSFQDTLKISFDAVSYFVGLLLCYIICVILISYQWIIVQRREIGIRRLLGASKGQIAGRLGLQYTIYMILSFVIGFVYCKIFYPSYLVSFYKGYGISLGILIIFIAGTILKILNDSIEEVIK